MKGIILAGGKGTRLYPLTLVTNKVLLPVYDKPMVFYPLSVLMQAGIKDILIISTPQDLPNFKKLLGTGENFGINLSYAEEPVPKGSAEVFTIGKEFIGKDAVTVIYGDNIIYGIGLAKLLKEAVDNAGRATVFGYYVNDPRRFGVVEFDENNKVISVEEKPANPKSNYAVIGLYVYDNRAVNFVKNVKPSERNELEITSVVQMYLEAGDLDVKPLDRGFAWLDTGTVDSLMKANEFIRVIEEQQNTKIAALEEIAYLNGWITKDKLSEIAEKYSKSSYGQYLLRVAEGKIKHN
jgi:glucose-1-phosphate thymidylyltransferase, short form